MNDDLHLLVLVVSSLALGLCSLLCRDLCDSLLLRLGLSLCSFLLLLGLDRCLALLLDLGLLLGRFGTGRGTVPVLFGIGNVNDFGFRVFLSTIGVLGFGLCDDDLYDTNRSARSNTSE